MKKFLLLLATTGMVMTGCSQSEIIGEAPEAQTGKIGFASHINKGTRALDNTNFSSFKVFGSYTMPTETNSPIIIFNDIEVTKDGNVWKYDNPRYWVPTASYRFAAYSVEDGLPTGTRANYAPGADHICQLNIVDYISDKDNQKDLVYASTTTTITGKDKDNAAVALEFGHILSRIQLQFISNFPAGYNVKISNVRVNNIRNKGNFLGASKKWDDVDRTNDNITVEPKFPTDKDICSAANGDAPAVDATTEFVYVIPFPYQFANVDFFFDITVYNSNIKIFENSLKAQLKPNWEINKQYRYKIKLTGTDAGLEPIEFTGNVTEWDDTINEVDAGQISAGELPTENN